MKLYCRDGLVIAWHEDAQEVPASAYGEGIVIIPHAGGLDDLGRVGDKPENGPDVRPYAAPEVDLVAYAADARWRKEVGGITVAGVPVATDDRSKQMIMGARMAADADANWSTQWVGADGSIHAVNSEAIIAISNAVQAHVNECFATFAVIKGEIDSGEVTTTAEIDTLFE